MMDKNTYYLDKLGMTRWVPRQATEQTSRLLLIHDADATADNMPSSLLDSLYTALHLNASNALILAYPKEGMGIKSYLIRFDKIIIFGESLSTSIGDALLKRCKKLLVIPHRLSEGLSALDKKSLYMIYSQWMH